MTSIPKRLRQQVIERGLRRCEYCFAPLVIMVSLEVDHIIPASKGSPTTLENLCLTCIHCNGHKLDFEHGIDPHSGEEVTLFNPRQQRWSDHFEWVEQGLRIRGLTPAGRATVERLCMNRNEVIEARQHWIVAGWYPPSQAETD